MRKLFHVLIITLFLHICQELPANAAIYFVRCDGSNPTNCTGTTNAAYPGNGTGQACAWNSPNWAIGANQQTGGQSARMAAGDTLMIDGERHAGCTSVTNSGRAEYEVGLNAPNEPAGGNCDPLFPYGCYLNIAPAGANSSTKTKIYGVGYDSGCQRPPQIWGSQALSADSSNSGVLRINSNTDVKCLEITDHSGCAGRDHPGGGNIDNSGSQDPIQCAHNYNVNPGRWADIGLNIATGAHDIDLTDIWIHGMAKKAVFANSLTGNINLTRFHIRGNGFNGWDSNNNADYTGAYTWTGGDLDFSGCGEKYPPTHIFTNLRSQDDIHNCWSQSQGGYGDGLGTSAKLGNWTVKNIDAFSNVSDALDWLYNAGATIKVEQSTFEANAGAAIKSYSPNVYIENNVILGNCTNWLTNPTVFGEQTATGRSGTTCNNNGVCNANENFQHCADCHIFDYCRPASQTAISLLATSGVVHRIIGNTISATGDTIIGETNGGTCNGTESIYSRNNVILGSTDYNGGDSSAFFYAECGGVTPTINEDYDFICQTKNIGTDCTGVHSHCYANCSSLNLVGPLKDFSPTYYSGTNYIAAHYLTSSSPAHSGTAADETVTLQGTSNDATQFNRRATWDAGGLEYRPLLTLSTDYWRVTSP